MTDEADFIAQCQFDYSTAEITALGHTASNTNSFINLMTVVELLHSGLEQNPLLSLPHTQGGYPRRKDLGTRAGKLYVQRWATPVRDAVKWYRSCSAGTMVVPGTPNPATIQLPELESDPPWPHLVVEEHDFWDHSPLWGARPGGSRWHRLVPLAPVDVTSGWDASDFQKARAWLMAEIHLDLFSRSVLVGSCHLRLPNPLYRRLAQHIRDDWRGIEFELSPYEGQTISGLELTLWNRRAWGTTAVRQVPLKEGRNVVEVPEGVEQVGHAVTCTKRGLLEQTESEGFISSVQQNMSLITEQRRVQVTPSEEYTVGVSGHTEQVQVGEPRPASALARLAEDEAQSGAMRLWEQLHVRWFDKNAAGGTQAVRGIISGGRARVDFLDPYFSGKDLRSFALATTVLPLPVRILTSAMFCRMKDDEMNMESGEALLRELQSVVAQEPRLLIEIKVMKGKKSPVHDRFLIVDTVVWLLGASLNEFGERGSLLLRLPTPPTHGPGGSRVLSIADDVFAAYWGRGPELSPSLKDWVEERRNMRSDDPD